MAEEDSEFKSLFSITQGAVLYFAGKILNDGLGFLLQFVLSRGLGAGVYGIFAYGETILKIAKVFTNLGSDKAMLKFLPEYKDNPDKQRFMFALAMFSSSSASILLGVVLYVIAPVISAVTLGQPALVGVVRLFAVILILDTVAQVLHSVFRSLEQLEYEVASNKIARPVFRLLAVVVALGLGGSVVGTVASLVAAGVLTLGFASYLLWSQFQIRPSVFLSETNRQNINEFYTFSVPLTLKDAGQILINRVDVLMVGFFLSASTVGVYNISILLAGLLTIPLYAFNQLFPPVASRLYSAGQFSQLNSLYNTVTRWVFTLSFIFALAAVVYRTSLLRLFGSEFTAGTRVLILFVAAQLFNSVGGPNGYILMMADRQYLLVINQFVFGILNVVLNYILITNFGAIGAAVATASVLASLNLVKTIELWHLEGLFPYSTNFWKPVVSGTLAAVIMLLGRFVLDGVLLLIIGGVAGVVSYAGALYVLGIEDDDREFFEKIIGEI